MSLNYKRLVLLTTCFFVESSAFSSTLCEQRTPAGLIAEVANQAANLSCGELRDGDTRVVRTRSEPSASGRPANYKLMKKIDGSYQISLDVDFVPTAGVKNEKFQQRWSEKVKLCMTKYRSTLRAVGTPSIDIVISEDASPTSHRDRITITKLQSRNLSLTWDESIECATMIHELLHLAGLYDEYDEGAQSGAKIWDCRVSIHSDSIMGNHHANRAALAEGEDSVMEGLMCDCPVEGGCPSLADAALSVDGKLTCKGGEESSKPPRVWKWRKGDSDAQTKIQYFSSGSSGDASAPSFYTIQRRRQLTDSDVLLTQNQFNALVFPGCLKKNSSYYSNGQNAYRTSVQAGGAGCFQF